MRSCFPKAERLCALAALAAFAFAATAVAAPAPAGAAQCAPHADMTTLLDKRFEERRRALGLLKANGIMELYVAKSGTWTVLLTSPKGVACIVAAGEGWEDVPVQLAGPGA